MLLLEPVLFLYLLRVRRFESEEVAIVAATCDLLRNNILGLYICEHLFKADSILIHLVRYDLFRIGRCECLIIKVIASRLNSSTWDEVSWWFSWLQSVRQNYSSQDNLRRVHQNATDITFVNRFNFRMTTYSSWVNIFKWCCTGWHLYINELENNLAKVKMKPSISIFHQNYLTDMTTAQW